MSKLDIIEAEITRRKKTTEALLLGEADLLATQEQFSKLDEMYRSNEKTSRDRLESLYKESRHFSGKQPVVYSFSLTEKYPVFGGQADADCNPYFPITKVQNLTFDGISPLFADPTRVGAHQREATYSATENVPRTPALAALQAFPDISQEPLPAGWPGPQTSTAAYCSGASGATQPICVANGGTWVASSPVPDPVWVGANTATAKLRVPLQSWKADIQAIKADLFEDSTLVEQNYWQNIINDIDTVLSAVSSNAVFIRATGNPNPAAWGQTQGFIPGSPQAIARNNLITAAQTGIPNHISSRLSSLNSIANKEEQVFFGIIKLRMHQANGSFIKLKTIKYQLKTNKSIIDDNNNAISSLNILKVKNS